MVHHRPTRHSSRMNLVRCLPLALVAAARGQDVPAGGFCVAESAAAFACASGADGAPEENACMACLEAEGRRGLADGAMPDEAQVDAAVAACTAAGTACDGCLAPLQALAACSLTAMKEIQAMQGAMKIETEIEPDAEVPADLSTPMPATEVPTTATKEEL